MDKTENLYDGLDRLAVKIRARLLDMKKMPAVNAAIEYVWIRATVDELAEKMKELNKLKTEAQYSVLPAVFERDRATTLTLEIGYRVTLSSYVSASILAKEKAFEWLRKNGHKDIIQETVNASTLGAFAGSQLEEGIDLPDNLFKVTVGSRASVTKVATKK